MGNARLKHVGSRFTIVPNDIITDSNISFRAKGVYTYLRSRPDNWEFRVPNIANAGKEGRDAVQKAIKELELSGYINRVANKTEDGKFDGWIWHIHETPINRDIDRLPENPSVGFSVSRFSRQTESQAENNNTIQNNNIPNNIIHNNSVVAVFHKYGINIKSVLDKYPDIFTTRREEEWEAIASTLAEKRDTGKVANPVGLLMANPASVIDDILAGRFYPDSPPKKKKEYDAVEIYSRPKDTRYIVAP